jgi:hypothetical protein
MDHHDLTGYYTYRSFRNQPHPTDDLNDILFGQGEMFLSAAPDGAIAGTLAFPADVQATEKQFMDITGRVTGWSPVTVEMHGIGRSGTPIADYDYRYQVSLAPTYDDAVRQRRALVGTVLRAKPHGDAEAGVTASVAAVQRDFLRPREIPQVALIPEAIEMLASRRHRLQHAVWHTTRAVWHTVNTNADAVSQIKKLGWWPERPPILQAGGLDLENGAGEDFLYMHRKMIRMLHEVYAGAGAVPPAGWTDLPAATTPQMVFRESSDSGSRRFVFDPGASGFMVPPPARDNANDRMFKSPAFRNGTMQPLARLFRSPRFLSSLTLGQLGNMVEFTIHNWMHLRWMDTAYEADGRPVARETFDVDPKWDDAANDDLGDFYSSHVHPVFWRLHGWVDDRINDWAAANADRLVPATVDDVAWFAADGDLVKVSEPFYWPSHGHHHPGANDSDIEAMVEVMRIMKEVVEPGTSFDRQPPTTGPRTAREMLLHATLGVTVPGLSDLEAGEH